MVRIIYASADKKEFVHTRGLKNNCQCRVHTNLKTCLGYKGIPEKVINSFVKNGILSWGKIIWRTIHCMNQQIFMM